MELSEAHNRVSEGHVNGCAPHIFHPADVLQLRTRFEELREEQHSWLEPVFRRSIAREVCRLRKILQALDEGTSVVTVVADRAA